MTVSIDWMDDFITIVRNESGRNFMAQPLNAAECARIGRYWRLGMKPEHAAEVFMGRAPIDPSGNVALTRNQAAVLGFNGRRFERDCDDDSEGVA